MPLSALSAKAGLPVQAIQFAGVVFGDHDSVTSGLGQQVGQPLDPEAVRADVLAHVGCIAGAPLVGDLKAMIATAGLVDLALENKAGAVSAMLPDGDPMAERLAGQLPATARLADYVASMVISARKPR